MIVDMWERGELGSEKHDGGESVDVVGEFAKSFTGVLHGEDSAADVKAANSHECTGEGSPLEHLFERSGAIMN